MGTESNYIYLHWQFKGKKITQNLQIRLCSAWHYKLVKYFKYHIFIFWMNWPFECNTELTTALYKVCISAWLLLSCPYWKGQAEVSRWGGRTKHLERWRRGRWREYKDRGVGGRLSGEMRAPPAPCRGWVGRDISNLLKLIASQTLSSLPSPSVVKPMPRLWRAMMNGLNVKDLKPSSDPP